MQIEKAEDRKQNSGGFCLLFSAFCLQIPALLNSCLPASRSRQPTHLQVSQIRGMIFVSD